MIDIHTHILPEVDDGSVSLEHSLSMIRECVKQGTTDIILTPHYRKEYKLKADLLKDNFIKFKENVEKSGIPVNLYLGKKFLLKKIIKHFLKKRLFFP